MISSPAPKHVPAWRKLGLKLKNAKEEPQEPARLANGNSYEAGEINHKRKASGEPETLGRALAPAGHTKKNKKTKFTLLDSESLASATVSADLADSAPQPPATSSIRKPKSVTFAPETKAEDGDSIKQIYRKWLASQRKSDPDFNASRISPALKFFIPASNKTRSEQQPTVVTNTAQVTNGDHSKVEKKKKKKSKPNAQTSHPPQPSQPTNNLSTEYIHPALRYLTTYHTSAQSWKFNKAHQNYLLKHLFHLANVPSSYDPALVSYLKGLASENTKARVRRDALEVKAEDEKWLISTDSDPKADQKGGIDKEDEGFAMGVERETLEQSLARRLRDYNAAVEKLKVILETKEDDREAAEWHSGNGRKEWEERLMKRRRAEVVLWGVGEVGGKVMAALQSAVGSETEAGNVRKVDQQPAFRREMGPKRIKFGDEKEDVDIGNGVKPTTITRTNMTNAVPAAAPADKKKKRKRKQPRKNRVGAIPDDESSSSSNSEADESEDEEIKRMAQRKKELQERLAAQKRELDRARKEVEEELSDETSSDEESELGNRGRRGSMEKTDDEDGDEETSSSGSESEDGEESD